MSKKSEELLRRLDEMAAEPIGRCAAMAAMRIVQDSTVSFERKAEPEGGYQRQWKPWAKSTREGYERSGIARRRAKRMPKAKRMGRTSVTHSLLKATGTLMRSIVASYRIEGSARARVQAGVTGAAPYGVTHQEGTTRAGKRRNVTIPTRPFIGLTPDGKAAISRFFAENVKAAVGGKGKGRASGSSWGWGG